MKNYRIYYSLPITINSIITLPKADSHHLINVLRLNKDNMVNLFNQNGEWITKIISANKNSTKVLVLEQFKLQEITNKKIHLLYAPLKNIPNSFLITKVTELGVDKITQVITAQTTNKALETEKIELKVKQATEQCGRLTLPKINPTISLTNLLKNLGEQIFWLNEHQTGFSLLEAINSSKSNSEINLLIGPEGGFSKEEFSALNNNKFVTPVHLKGNILKAETASVVATALAVYL